MATVTADTAVHMDRMVEVSVIRQAVDLHPRDRLACLPAIAHCGQTGTVGQDLTLAMAIDTGLGGRQVRVTCNLYEAMAIATIHPELLHMQGMGEGHRLVGLVADAGVLRREIVPDPKSDGSTDYQAADKQLERKPIGPSGKEIRHSGVRETPGWRNSQA